MFISIIWCIIGPLSSTKVLCLLQGMYSIGNHNSAQTAVKPAQAVWSWGWGPAAECSACLVLLGTVCTSLSLKGSAGWCLLHSIIKIRHLHALSDHPSSLHFSSLNPVQFLVHRIKTKTKMCLKQACRVFYSFYPQTDLMPLSSL